MAGLDVLTQDIPTSIMSKTMIIIQPMKRMIQVLVRTIVLIKKENKNSLDQVLEVISENDSVVLRFWAPWCAPCRMMEQIVRRSTEGTNIKVVDVNVDEHIDVAEYFDVMSIPHIKGFKKGAEVVDVIGYTPEKVFKQRLIDKIR